MKITVVVPTYLRPQDLARCLTALKLQNRPVDEVWVIVRDTDHETWQFLESYDREALPLHTATVTVTGVIAAMNIGLDASRGDIVAFTDDDAAPHPDWLQRIEAYYLADEKIGGVGGRDWVYYGTKLEDGARAVVGKVQWFGRVIGNHHIGSGAGREVDVLKGVNMSFRRQAIADLHFDHRMRGSGAQVHFELAFSLAMKKQGWKLIYDPQIAVDHFPAQRFDEDQRHAFNSQASVNAVHNETVALLEYLSPLHRFVFAVWAIAIGTSEAFGLLQWLRFLPKDGNIASQKLRAGWGGRWEGWQTWRKTTTK
ncbi:MULTISPECIES: glycosyltransferase family 2 protein [Pseudanabaena]|uniref:Glycosyl transferase family 2 n=2 Tax=Pseudanabaena TaxID=1152 RepID=L8MV05_9CYAN|nr:MULTISPECIES: glycosyltransferase family 2 protein [Pseudanabaena]ELS30654.1 glycosyl transferase family 2 [Pseudanabaena biceps PCC 7429]MDG3497079.1 glycosyltransferase family 2 protein [Pseudanabaena catenata USMAC16]